MRRAAGSALAAIDVNAIIDHVSRRTKDSASARLRGVKLPSFEIPGIPFRVDPGTGTSNLDFTMKGGGDQLYGRWAIASQKVSWVVDTAGRSLNEIERLVWRVVSGLSQLEVVAELLPLALEYLAPAQAVDRPVLRRGHEPGARVVRDA